MKTIKILFLILTLICLLPISSQPRPNLPLASATNAESIMNAPDSVALKLESDKTDVLVNSQFKVRLTISQVTELHHFQLAVSFDPTMLRVDSVKEGSFLSNFGQDTTRWRQTSPDNSKGRVDNISCTRLDTSGVSGQGILATLYLSSLSTGISSIHFVQTTCQLNDPDSNSIPIIKFSAISLNIYREPVVQLTLPDTSAAPNRYIDIPLSISGVVNFDIISALIEVQFDSSCLIGSDVIQRGTLTENWQPPVVNNQPTKLFFALVGSQPLAKDGILVLLRFLVNPRAKENNVCNLIFSEVMLNEGDPTTTNRAGLVRIRGLQIAGTIIYQGTRVPVPDANVNLLGQQKAFRFSDDLGGYNFTQLPYGNYQLSPQKKGSQGKSISPFDAALTMQYVVGINQLTPYQLIAADVSGDGSISSFDASLIMRYSVRLEKKFPVMSDSLDFWDFVPAAFPMNITNWASHPDSLRYAPLAVDQFKQDFIGMIHGDVSQNWIDPGKQSGGFEKSELMTSIHIGDARFENQGIVQFPIQFEKADAIISAEIEMEYPYEKLDIISVNATELSRDFLINSSQRDGHIKIVMAGARPISGSGVLVEMSFILKSAATNFTDDIKITQALLNDRQVTISASNSDQQGALLPQHLELSQNYPNPFNPDTWIVYQLPQKAFISLEIYNSLGQRVVVLEEGEKQAGTHRMMWHASDASGQKLPSGIYICRLQVGDRSVDRKMILMQ